MKQMIYRDEAEGTLAYSFKEAADRLHCSISAVRRLAKAGVLKGFSLTGGAILTRVTARSLREFVEGAGVRQKANQMNVADGKAESEARPVGLAQLKTKRRPVGLAQLETKNQQTNSKTKGINR